MVNGSGRGTTTEAEWDVDAKVSFCLCNAFIHLVPSAFQPSWSRAGACGSCSIIHCGPGSEGTSSHLLRDVKTRQTNLTLGPTPTPLTRILATTKVLCEAGVVVIWRTCSWKTWRKCPQPREHLSSSSIFLTPAPFILIFPSAHGLNFALVQAGSLSRQLISAMTHTAYILLKYF
jgi:hypothetical protein